MYKVGDRVKLIVADRVYKDRGMETGDILTVNHIGTDEEVFVDFKDRPSIWLHAYQLELVQLAESTKFNFITVRLITEHLQNVITFYEDYTSDLLKETARDYKENIIDLKETGYEFRLELDKILIQVEEGLL